MVTYTRPQSRHGAGRTNAEALPRRQAGPPWGRSVLGFDCVNAVMHQDLPLLQRMLFPAWKTPALVRTRLIALSAWRPSSRGSRTAMKIALELFHGSPLQVGASGSRKRSFNSVRGVTSKSVDRKSTQNMAGRANPKFGQPKFGQSKSGHRQLGHEESMAVGDL